MGYINIVSILLQRDVLKKGFKSTFKDGSWVWNIDGRYWEEGGGGGGKNQKSQTQLKKKGF